MSRAGAASVRIIEDWFRSPRAGRFHGADVRYSTVKY